MLQWGLGSIDTSGRGGLVVTVDSHAALLADVVDDAPDSIVEMLADWAAWCDRIDRLMTSADIESWAPMSAFRFKAPFEPTTIYACGANYYDHVEEMIALTGHGRIPDKKTERVFHFQISTSALTGHDHPVRRPAGCEMLDYEVELAAVIGVGGQFISESDALDHVAAYTVVNDVSLRDDSHQHPIFGANFLMAKSQATMQPMGPSVIPARFVADPGNLRLTMKVNGETRQKGTTATMIWSLPEQIAALSRMVVLRPGDVIMTGTPAGTSAAFGRYLSDGDVMEAEVEGIGTLVNTIAVSV